jgi:hypothetical protein
VAAEGVGAEAEEGEEVEGGEEAGEGEEGAVAGTKGCLCRGRLGQGMAWPTDVSPLTLRLEMSVGV